MGSPAAIERRVSAQTMPTHDALTSTLGELGAIAQPVARYLATRADLLSTDVRRQLGAFRSDAAPLPADAVRARLAELLGDGADAPFAWVAPRPVAFDGLCQTHEARTRSGREVLVKLRCGQVDAAVPDLGPVVRSVGSIAGLASSERTALADQIRAWVGRQSDLEAETAERERMARASRGPTGWRTPRPIPELCGKAVLTLEHLRGTPIAELLREDGRGGSSLVQLGFDAKRLGDNLVLGVLQQVFEAKRFHADVTPSNLVALPGSRVAFVEGVHVVPLDPVVSRNQFAYLSAVLAGDVERILDAFFDLAEAPSREALESFGRAFRQRARGWEQERFGDTASADASPHAIIGATLELLRTHGLRLSDRVRTMLCAVAAADEVATRLHPRAGLETALDDFLPREQIRGLVRELSPSRLNRIGLDLFEIATEGPGSVARLLADLSSQRFVLRVQTVESEETRAASNTRAKLIATGGLLVAIALTGGIFRLEPPSSVLPWIVLLALGAVAGATFLLLWARLR